jgi:cell wall-associated NlpC family hydrolase
LTAPTRSLPPATADDASPEHHDRAAEVLSRAGRFVVGAVALVVVLIVAAVVALVVVAATSRPPASAGVIVFTVQAPYNPTAKNEVALPVDASVPAPRGDWTYARGLLIARRALHWINWPYSFDAGDQSGPTYGRAVDAASRNDASVRGFDCSGLVINAMAPYRNLDHSAAAQYSEAGSFHPALTDLQPGDLVFWSSDGTINAIGHVAIYIGNGNVVQAPHSGAYVDVVRLDQVEPGRIGITRPLT